MKNLDIQSPKTQEEKPTIFQRFTHLVKVALIHLLILAAAGSFLMYHMENKARDMERSQYKQELDALKAQLPKGE